MDDYLGNVIVEYSVGFDIVHYLDDYLGNVIAEYSVGFDIVHYFDDYLGYVAFTRGIQGESCNLQPNYHTHSTDRLRSFVYNCVVFTSLNE